MTHPDDQTRDAMRVEPDYRNPSGTPEGFPDDIEPITSYTGGRTTVPDYPARGLTTAELDGAFDDPAHGEPGRDRIGIHLIWELVLLVGAALLAFAVARTNGALSSANLHALLVEAAILGVLALGAGLSLRAGTPNLAVGPIFVLAGLLFADRSSTGFNAASGAAVGAAAICGLALALVVTFLHVPAWAASLGAAAGVAVWMTRLPANALMVTTYHPESNAIWWFVAFAVVAVVAGLLGTLRPVRRALGRFRPVADPALRRGGPAAVVAALALLFSSVLAGVAGVAFTMWRGVGSSSGSATYGGIALGIVLLAGTSAFGRRGGVFGTLLATGAVVLAMRYVEVHRWRGGDVMVIAAAIGVGLLVTRLVERFGRPQGGFVDDPAGELSWAGPRPGNWSRDLPAADDPGWS